MAALALSTSAASWGQKAKETGSIYHTGKSVQVSTDLATEPHYEMEIAANPENNDQLIACSMVFPYGSATTVVANYASFDSGKTWKMTLKTEGERNMESWDPDCRYGPDSVAYALSEGLRPKDPRSYDRVDRSTDGGKTWESPNLMVHAERTFISIDPRPGPQHGWIYLYGCGNNPVNPGDSIRIGYSPDGGKTYFSQPAMMEPGLDNVGMGPGAILSDGSVVFPVAAYKPDKDDPYGDIKTKRPGELRVFRAKFVQPGWPLKTISAKATDWFIQRDHNGSFIPRLAVDATDGPYRDRIYLTWEEPKLGRSLVKFSYSSDRGKTWSQPRLINDDIGRPDGRNYNGPDDIHGIVAVNKDGVVGVMWLDRREHADDLGWNVRFRASFDGGETFAPSVVIPDADYDPSRKNVIPLFPGSAAYKEPATTNDIGIGWFSFNGGHTIGLTASVDGKFHPLWMSNVTGVPQMWTTDITVDGKAVKDGNAELAKMADVSKLVSLEFINRSYDLKTHELDFDLELQNVSEAVVKGPLKVKILDVGSYVGNVNVIGGDTMTPAEGTVLDFSSLLPGRALKLNEMTKPLHVRLDVRGLDPYSQIGKFSSGLTPLAILTTKVFAGSVEGEAKSKAQEEAEKDWPGSGVVDVDRDE
jgi:hypothetical protein